MEKEERTKRLFEAGEERKKTRRQERRDGTVETNQGAQAK
jgi:hypothetical protein